MADNYSSKLEAKLRDLLFSKNISSSVIVECENGVNDGKYENLLEAIKSMNLLSEDEIHSVTDSKRSNEIDQESTNIVFTPPSFEQDSELFVPNLQPIFWDEDSSDVKSDELQVDDEVSKYTENNIATSVDLEEGSLKSKKQVNFDTGSLRAGIISKKQIEDDNFESEYIAPPPAGSTRRSQTSLESISKNKIYKTDKLDLSQASTRKHRKTPDLNKLEESKSDSESDRSEASQLSDLTVSVDLKNLKGYKLADRYELIELINFSGNSVVYRAKKFNTKSKKQYAIKIISPDAKDPAKYLKRFKQEAELLQRLSHGPNIVRINAFGKDKDLYYLAMNYVDGESLADLIARKAPLDEELTLQIIKEVLRALYHAHSNGVIHRDIKSANILIGKNGTIQLTDFGLALDKSLDHPKSSGSQLLGTPHYMAPEQVDNKEVDARTDLYSLGVVLYECLTGKLPIEETTDLVLLSSIISKIPENPSKHNPKITKFTEKIIVQLLKKEPRARFNSAKELFDVIVKRGGKPKKQVSEQKKEKPKTLEMQNLIADSPQPKTSSKQVEKPQKIDKKDDPVDLLADDDLDLLISYPGLRPSISSREKKNSGRSKRALNINNEKYKHSITKSQRIVAEYRKPWRKFLKIAVTIIILGALAASAYILITSI